MFRRTHLAAATAAAVLAIGVGAHAAGAASSKPALQIDGFGSYVVRDYGDAVMNGNGTLWTNNAKKSQAVTVAAVISPDDHSLPTGEDCESATATISIYESGRADMTLMGIGQVCARYPQPPTSIVTHVFTGRYEVLDGPSKLVGTDGWFEIRLGTDNVASTTAIDT
jgi:hypothetical protein